MECMVIYLQRLRELKGAPTPHPLFAYIITTE